jgi:hypothetical protein
VINSDYLLNLSHRCREKKCLDLAAFCHLQASRYYKQKKDSANEALHMAEAGELYFRNGRLKPAYHFLKAASECDPSSLNTEHQRLLAQYWFMPLLDNYQLSDPSDKSLGTVLRRAAARGQLHDVQLCLSHGIAANTVDENPKERRSALHWAVEKDQVECVKALLQAGADPMLADARKPATTPSSLAEQSSNPEIRKLFTLSASAQDTFVAKGP